jgi:DNA-binding transcriptional LysR family regulator
MLRDEQFIVTRREPGPEVHDYIVRRVADFSTYPRVERKPCTQETLMSLVALGQGITLVSSVWTEVRMPGLVFRPLTACEDVVPFSAVWSPDNDNPALRRFVSVAYLLAGRSRHGKALTVRAQRPNGGGRDRFES